MNIDTTKPPIREILPEEVAYVVGGHSYFSPQIEPQIAEVISSLTGDPTELDQGQSESSDGDGRELANAPSSAASVAREGSADQAAVDLRNALAEFFYRPFELEDQLSGL